MFTDTLFTTAKTWKQPNAHQWMNKDRRDTYTCVYVYIYEYYSAIRKKGHPAICDNMNGS